MPDHALKDILEVEKEIQAQLDIARKNAADWLSRERTALSLQSEKQLADFREQCQSRLRAAEQEARDEATQLIANARRYKDFLENIPAADLEKVIRCFLPRLLPET